MLIASGSSTAKIVSQIYACSRERSAVMWTRISNIMRRLSLDCLAPPPFPSAEDVSYNIMTDECRTTEAQARRLKAGPNRARGEVEEIIHAICFLKSPNHLSPEGTDLTQRACAIHVSVRVCEVTGMCVACCLRHHGYSGTCDTSELSLGLKGLLQHHTDVCCCTYPIPCREHV